MKHFISKKSPEYEKYKKKLFEIARAPRKIHSFPEILLPKSLDEPLRENELFSNVHSYKILELGCGWGEFMIEWLKKNPKHEYIAFEIENRRIRFALQNFIKEKVSSQAHLKIIPINFSWFLTEILPKHCFDEMIINFPDPWPKRRHWKHRLIQNEFFLEQTYELLKEKGRISINTDFGPYARKILKLFRNSKNFTALYPWPNYIRTHPPELPYTTFEKIHLSNHLRPYYQTWIKN